MQNEILCHKETLRKALTTGCSLWAPVILPEGEVKNGVGSDEAVPGSPLDKVKVTLPSSPRR